MRWFTDLFRTRPHTNPTIEPDLPWPRTNGDFVILPKGALYVPPKDISEPVYAIVKAMNERPSSFKLISTNITGGKSFSQTEYTVKDIKTNQVLVVTLDISFYSDLNTNYTYSWSWITQDEGDLLCREFMEINKKKMRRKFNMQRAAMKAIYT